jgi:nucleoside 2-deoxyribosyltransferase
VPTEYEEDPCEVCNQDTAQTLFSNFDGVHQNCPRCGEFKFTGTANVIHRNSATPERRAKLSGWVRDQNRNGSIPLVSTGNLESILTRSIPSVADRAIYLLTEASTGLQNLGDNFNVNEPRFLAATYSASTQDVGYLMKMLKERGLAETIDMSGNGVIHPEGHMRLDELKAESSNSKKGFVAMWFHEDLDQIYADGFAQGVLNAGYDPIRIDQVEHVNKIDDEIIRQINAAKFLVADFTGHRGGVYFEAGYAMGRKIPVFWTCRSDDMGELHFDIRQFNCIAWNSSEDLAQRLEARIESVVGPGPNK